MIDFGWYEDKFIPYTDEIIVTGAENFERNYNSIHEEGDLKTWLEEIRDIRKSIPVRLIMAASFSSILNEKVGKSCFVTHIWGGSGSGKTVALYAAASIWANPEKGHYIAKLNNTSNFVSRLAAFLYNMPVVLDELETFDGDSKQLNELIMNLAEGIDRGKAKKEGGVQDLKVWHNTFLMSGEHSISNENLGGGTYNRLIEIYCKGKIIPDGVRTSTIVKKNYGFVGKFFVEYVKKFSDEDLRKMYNQFYKELLQNKNTEEKQAQNMAMLMLGDKLAVDCIFPEEENLKVEQVTEFMFSKEEIDISERAWNFIQSELAANVNKFMIGNKENLGYECWGKIVNDTTAGDWVAINKNILQRLLEKNGYDYKKTVKNWVEKKYIEYNEKEKRNDFKGRLNHTLQRYYRLNLKLIEGV